MDVNSLLNQLRNEQLEQRDKKIFEKYDKVFIQDLVLYLNKYNQSILLAANIHIPQATQPLSAMAIASLSKITQLQRALLYHVTTVQRLIFIINKVLKKAETETGICTIINPSTIWASLPKLEVVKEFLAQRIPRYGKYIAELQISDHDAYRSQSIIIKQAQQELALNIFKTLRKLFPDVFASKPLLDNISNVLRTRLADAHQETLHHSKYKNIWLYLKQFTKDKTLNIFLDFIQSLNIEDLISENIIKLLVTNTDDVDLKNLKLHIVELSDLQQNKKLNFNRDFYESHIKNIRLQRYQQLESIIFILMSKLTTINTCCINKAEIIYYLDKLLDLAPLTQNLNSPLKSKSKIDCKKIFDQSNVAPIIIKIKTHLAEEKQANKKNHNQIIINQLLLELKTLLNQSIQNIEHNTAEDISSIECKYQLTKLYPDNTSLFNAIGTLNKTIENNTKINIFDNKQKNQTAKQAESYRKELLYLLWDRVKIACKQIPTPSLSQWDSFLAHETKGILDTNDSWRNSFYAFTALGTSSRFPALLSDQLFGLYKIINLRINIAQLLITHGGTLPERDKLEPLSNRIAGTSHLAALVPKLITKQQQLNSFILYTQLSSISHVLIKISNPSENIINLRNQVSLLLNNIRQQAEQNNYYITIPDQAVFTDLIKQLKNLSSIELQITPSNKSELMDSLLRLNNFYYGSHQERLAAIQGKLHTNIFMKPIHKFRRLILAIFKLYDNIREIGFISAIATLFKLQDAEPSSNILVADPEITPPDLQEIFTKTKQNIHTKEPCLTYFGVLSRPYILNCNCKVATSQSVEKIALKK